MNMILIIILLYLIYILKSKNDFINIIPLNIKSSKINQNKFIKKKNIIKTNNSDLFVKSKITRDNILDQKGGSYSYKNIKMNNKNQTENIVNYNKKYESYRKLPTSIKKKLFL